MERWWRKWRRQTAGGRRWWVFGGHASRSHASAAVPLSFASQVAAVAVAALSRALLVTSDDPSSHFNKRIVVDKLYSTTHNTMPYYSIIPGTR